MVMTFEEATRHYGRTHLENCARHFKEMPPLESEHRSG